VRLHHKDPFPLLSLGCLFLPPLSLSSARHRNRNVNVLRSGQQMGPLLRERPV
jgi:hypothetical protein